MKLLSHEGKPPGVNKDGFAAEVKDAFQTYSIEYKPPCLVRCGAPERLQQSGRAGYRAGAPATERAGRRQCECPFRARLGALPHPIRSSQPRLPARRNIAPWPPPLASAATT